MKKILITISILISAYIFFLHNINPLFAANLHFKAYDYKEDFLVKLLLDTDGESINAVEGKIVFTKDRIEIREVSDGNSVINFWIDKPAINDKTLDGEISFSGITPGGFMGQEKTIFSLILRQFSKDKGSISFKDLKILKNNGQGLEVKVKFTPLSLPISPSSLTKEDGEKEDIYPPESFRPDILKDQNVSNGQYFLVFATQDKHSGINHYEVKEGQNGEFKTVLSPYLLTNQNVDQKLFIRAVDNARNEKIEELIPPNYTYWYRDYRIIAIILIIVLLFIRRKKWLKFIK